MGTHTFSGRSELVTFKVDPRKACEYIISCFKDPSTFTILIVGNLDPAGALPLILQYLGGIPKPTEPVLHFNRDDLSGLPFTFLATIVREIVRSPMVEAHCSVQIAFPVVLKNDSMMREIHFVGFLSRLLETKIMQVLRFKHGHVPHFQVFVLLERLQLIVILKSGLLNGIVIARIYSVVCFMAV